MRDEVEPNMVNDREKASRHLHDAADSIEAAIRNLLGQAVGAEIRSRVQFGESVPTGPAPDCTPTYITAVERCTEVRDQLRSMAQAFDGEAPQ